MPEQQTAPEESFEQQEAREAMPVSSLTAEAFEQAIAESAKYADRITGPTFDEGEAH